MSKQRTSVLGDLEIASRQRTNVNARIRKIEADLQRTRQEQRSTERAYQAARKAVAEAYPED